MFSSEYCEIFKNSFFYRTPPLAASKSRQFRTLYICYVLFSKPFVYMLCIVLQAFCIYVMYCFPSFLYICYVLFSKPFVYMLCVVFQAFCIYVMYCFPSLLKCFSHQQKHNFQNITML